MEGGRPLDLEFQRVVRSGILEIRVPVEEDDTKRVEVSIEASRHRNWPVPEAHTVANLTLGAGRVVAVREGDRRERSPNEEMVHSEVAAIISVVEAALCREPPIAVDGELETVYPVFRAGRAYDPVLDGRIVDGNIGESLPKLRVFVMRIPVVRWGRGDRPDVDALERVEL